MKPDYCRSFCILSIALLVLNACAPSQKISKPYPAWGKEILLPATESGSRLHFRVLFPKQPSASPACILIVHGMNEHVGRYRAIANLLASKYIVGGIDLRGHGLTNPILSEADQAIAKGLDSFDASDAFVAQSEFSDLQPMREDFQSALQQLAEICDPTPDYPAKPLFILSHSLGSLVAASYLLSPNDGFGPNNRIEGIIFSGPAFSVTQVPGWRGWIPNLFIRFTFHTHEHFLSPHDEPWPIMVFNQFIAFLTVPVQDGIFNLLSLPGARELFSPTTPNWVIDYLTDSEQAKQQHRKDGYIIRRTQLNYALGVEKEVIKFRRGMQHFDVPYLLVYSAGDPITPAWGNRDFLKATLYNHKDNKAIQLLDKSHHEHLFSKPPLDQYLLHEIDAWMTQRLESGKVSLNSASRR